MDRAFGAEIELTGITRQHALHVVRLVGMDIRDEAYNHETRTWWKIVNDGSIGGDGFEVVSPILRGPQGVEDLLTVVTALDDAGGGVTRRCALHIHVNGRDMTLAAVQSIVRRYAQFEEQIDAFMPRSRRGDGNQYCKSLRPFVQMPSFDAAQTLQALVDAQPSRYYKVNLKSHPLRGSIEFRQHSGTLNPLKVQHWLAFLHGFIRESCRLAGSSNTPLPRRLAALVALLAQSPEGLTVDALCEHLHIQPHSLRANITYIRRAGVEVESQRRGGITRYRLVQTSGVSLTDEGIFAGIDPQVTRFYQNRSLVLNANPT